MDAPTDTDSAFDALAKQYKRAWTSVFLCLALAVCCTLYALTAEFLAGSVTATLAFLGAAWAAWYASKRYVAHAKQIVVNMGEIALAAPATDEDTTDDTKDEAHEPEKVSDRT